MARHFLTLRDFSPAELQQLLDRAIQLKAKQRAHELYQPLTGQVLGMIFEKSSTRTRVSFEAAMIQFGGAAVFLSPQDTQLGRGEPLADTARVLSSMVDCIMVRTYAHDKIETIAKHSRVPVINGLTDTHHPCQLLADMQTFHELRGPIAGKTVAWIGDGNNMCNSYLEAAALYGFHLRIACPPGHLPNSDVMAAARDYFKLVEDPKHAVRKADLIVTDVWASMGQEQESKTRSTTFARFQVTPALMALAKPDAIFMHCLPAHRGEEVSAEVLDGPQSAVWEEAENRLHAQKALLEFLLVE